MLPVFRKHWEIYFCTESRPLIIWFDSQKANEGISVINIIRTFIQIQRKSARVVLLLQVCHSVLYWCSCQAPSVSCMKSGTEWGRNHEVGIHSLCHHIKMFAYQAFAAWVILFFIQWASSKMTLLMDVSIYTTCPNNSTIEIECAVDTDESESYIMVLYPQNHS